MEINVSNLEKDSEKLIKSIDNFSNNILNIYNELKWANGCWSDYHSRLFFTNVESEKTKVNNTYEELTQLSEIYKTIVAQYKNIGNKIQVNLENKDIIITKFNSFQDEINELISLYNDLDLSFCKDISIKISNQKEELLKIKENLTLSKEKIKETLVKIEEIEKDINLKLSKINIETIKQADINEYM